MKLNVLSFIGALLCIPLFLFTIFTPAIFKLFELSGTHPLSIVLAVILVVFLLGLIGLKDVDGWKSVTRSLVSLALTASLMMAIGFIMMVGSLLGP